MDALAVDRLPVTATEIASWAIALIAVAIVVIGGIVLLVSRRRKAARAEQAATADGADAPSTGSDGPADA
ncbi:LPXTG cell wall anchor domain-containing protein [Agrococcus sp. SGAir0287]|uniref:LPXTG cell wall anchor domain-containing protein n=1 Tax=Agrococcus sp. SGAir0287 TaxID=2070347 RepID=UPI0010F94009|nr:LPXTG cell wall anchor domain-containing protein [Agrococcus sp. SGAir0287]